MTVYVVIGGWDYEGFNNLGVFDNEKDAQAFANESYDSENYDYVDIENHEINKPRNTRKNTKKTLSLWERQPTYEGEILKVRSPKADREGFVPFRVFRG